MLLHTSAAWCTPRRPGGTSLGLHMPHLRRGQNNACCAAAHEAMYSRVQIQQQQAHQGLHRRPQQDYVCFWWWSLLRRGDPCCSFPCCRHGE
jgi:hypothetical protein